MNASTAWQQILFTIPSGIGLLVCLVFLFVLAKKPSWPLFYFLCFYLIGVYHLAGGLITSLISSGTGRYGIQRFWQISLAISRLRYLPLILFVHSAHRFRVTPVLTGFMTLVIAIVVAAPFFVYSIIPNLLEIVVVLYAFIYWLVVYLLRQRLSLSSRGLGLLRAVLICTGFFLTGVILDLLEDIPLTSLYVSILLVDFYPVYLVCIGVVMAVWAVRDLVRPLRPGEPEIPRTMDLSGLPVTKREGEIIGLILCGETNTTIANRLFISESTVKKHINNLFRKLKITSRWELLKLAGNLHPKK